MDKKQTRWFYEVAASALLVAAVFLGIKAYHPAESGTREGPRRSTDLFARGEPVPWSRGPSVDAVMATAAAGCFVGAVFLFRKRS